MGEGSADYWTDTVVVGVGMETPGMGTVALDSCPYSSTVDPLILLRSSGMSQTLDYILVVLCFGSHIKAEKQIKRIIII